MKRFLPGIVCLVTLLGLFPGRAGWAATEPSQEDMWEFLGGPNGGVVTALAMSPNYAADHTVFAGLRGGGLYRTVDWGGSWERLFGEFLTVIDLAISPAYANDGTVFATEGAETFGYEVLRTNDEGDTWYFVTPEWNGLPDPPRLSISPNFGDDGTLYILGGAQTYLSTDGGDTFVQAGGWFTDHHVVDLAFSPVYSTDLTLFALVPGDGLYESNDAGTSWHPTGLSGDLSTFAISPNYVDDQMMLAVRAADGQLLISDDGGDNWSPGSLILEPAGRHTLLFSPSFSATDQVILASSSADPGPYRSEDGGATWQPADWHDPGDPYFRGFVGGSVYALALAPDGIWDPAAYAGTSSGIYRSSNRGQHWSQHNDGMPRLATRVLDIAPGVPDTWLAGTSYSGHIHDASRAVDDPDGNLQLSIDRGQTWYDVSGRLDRVRSVAFSPAFVDDATAFAATGSTEHGGVYRSTDGGYNWVEVLGDFMCRGLAVSPDFAQDHTVWVSTATPTATLGIYASYDGGEVWASLAPAVQAELIVPSPNYAVDRTLFAGTADAGLQRSTDAGVSWTQVLSGSVSALAVSPAFGASQTLYAGVRANPGLPVEVYRSMDGGETWQYVDTGIPAWVGDAPLTISVLAYAADGSLLAGRYYGDEMEEGAVFRSVDGGETWPRLGYMWHHNNVFALESLPAESIAFYAGTADGVMALEVAQGGPAEPGVWVSNGPLGGRANALAVSPDFAADGVALAGTGAMGRHGNAWGLGIYRSADGGQTWQSASIGDPTSLSAFAIYDYAFSPGFATDQTAYAGTWGGLFKSTDGGTSWQQVYRAFLGPPGSITEVALAPDYPTSGHLMGGSPWGELYVSRDGGRNWTVNHALGPVDEIGYSPDFAVDATAFASGYPGGEANLFRTTDGGASWTPVLTQSICALAISPEFGSDGTIFAGGSALYISHDWGTTWISVTLPVEAPAVCPLAISPAFATDHTLFTATAEGLYRSDDGGMSWSHVSGYAGPPIRALAISPDWPAHPVLLIGGGHGVYRTEDGGSTWALARGMTSLSTESLVLGADGRSLVVGTYEYGTYRSGDGAESWSPQGLQESAYSHVADVAPGPGYPSSDTIFAALRNSQTMGGSIYRTTDGGATWEQVYTGQYVSRNALALSPQYDVDHTVYAAVGGEVLGSYDGGDSWSAVGAWPSGIYHPARQVALPPRYPVEDTLFAAGDGFWQLPPGATVWEPAASSVIMSASVEALAVSPAYAHDRLLLAATSSYDPQSGHHYALLRSTDGGIDWEMESVGVPDEPMSYVAFSPRFAIDRTAYLVCGDDLYRSIDAGLKWTTIGPAPDAPALHEVVVDRQGDVYLASSVLYHTTGSGVWHYSTPVQNIAIDSGFEAGSGWARPQTVWPAAYSQRVAYDGAWSMRIGVENRSGGSASYSSARQDVTIPGDAISATLQCHVYPVSGETTTAAQDEVLGERATATGDAQYLLVLDPVSGAILESLFWQLSNDQAWQPFGFDLMAYAGRTVKLHFGVYNDAAGGHTGMYVDNVSLNIWRPPVTEQEEWGYLPVILGEGP